ncbi:hypothetical protein SARC_06389 [Sphaeroforma arctica JP610]|uniref:Uncharacterized protein n=1 Tax=Sphaeroforma arctica JP610 TaxID=667725 RepID=A0A0L0FZ81_9EUKA|nr:hypothetical protein SARC_06389 [Sphaeroforma arctica JP610]KNC81278.1 hypothetical protein SARC_06389 [Sphaeroforma arctica JP610]|eukprot:XP_014155180.1 hypothetical protein SARC_06389 [Sphaeroforma arctica JP610]
MPIRFSDKVDSLHMLRSCCASCTARTYNYLWELIKKCTFISYEGEEADTRDDVLPFDNAKDILVPYLIPHGIADGAVRPNQKQYWAHFR